MFKTKICGVTRPEGATVIAEAGAEAIGLNFYEKSKRFVQPKDALDIIHHLPGTVKRVGVFVNASIDYVCETTQFLNLDFVQLHGDEPPEVADLLNEQLKKPVIRAFRCQSGLAPVGDYLRRCKTPPAAVLVDAFHPNEFGGTGKTLYWPDLADAAAQIGDIPLILAGGLTPSNVAEAISSAKPHGVDTASGVELAPGIKDADLSSSFVAAANLAFSAESNDGC